MRATKLVVCLARMLYEERLHKLGVFLERGMKVDLTKTCKVLHGLINSNPVRAKIILEISASPVALANSAVMNTMTRHCWWEDQTVQERTGHTP